MIRLKVFNAKEFEVKITKIITLCFIYLVHNFPSAALVKMISTLTHVFLKKDFQEHRNNNSNDTTDRVTAVFQFIIVVDAGFMTACLKFYCLSKGPLIVTDK